MGKPADLDFDPNTLREKYRAERAKRMRTDGIDQYVEVRGAFAGYVDDPYVEPGYTRDPVADEVDVLIVGGGFGGLLCGGRLREAGVEDIRVVEKGGDFGGTWYWNRYPGAQCDVESYIYMPMLEELGYIPTMKYASAAEILAHTQAIGRHFDLYDNALFQTEVTLLRWEEDSARWLVSTDRNDQIRARFVAMANGPLNRPKLPGIEGIEDFAGHAFHTSRWDYEYTGGSPEGGLIGLRDKRVAVVGTGATAVQCVPHLGETAKELYVFQRTPSSVDVRNNVATDPEWAAGLEPGWQRARMENFNNLVSGVPQPQDLVDDAWTDLIGKTIELFQRGASAGQSLPQIMERANFEKMNEIRARVDALVEDPEVAEALKPYYHLFCKRPTFHDEFLQTFNRPNVELVSTDGKGVDRITERGLVVGDVEYAVDCIIYATGFEVGTAYSRRAGYEVIGQRGQTLTDYWSDGMRTLHGVLSHGFPNCFHIGFAQGGFSVNFPHFLDQVATHLGHIISHALDNGIRIVNVTKEAEDDWVNTIVEKLETAPMLGADTCTPSYYNNEGKLSQKDRQGAPYGGVTGASQFWKLLERWRSEGSFAGLELLP